MPDKKCCNCKQILDLKNFHKDKTRIDGFNPRCKQCIKKVSHDSYFKHWTERNQELAQRRKDLSKRFKDYKRTLRCQSCGKTGLCLSFHHKNPKEKSHTVTYMVTHIFSWQHILDEINKCDVLCTNCHRKLHKNDDKGAKYWEDSPHKIAQLKRNMKRWFQTYKSSLKCEVCGENEPCCLDFHHIEDKIQKLARYVETAWSIEDVLKEMKKCRVLCGNCHREEHDKNKSI